MTAADRKKNRAYLKLGKDAYAQYWQNAERPTLRDALEEALNAVANAVAKDMY